MPLKIFRFDDPSMMEEQVNGWIVKAMPKIQTKHLCQAGGIDHLYIFYETPQENEYRKNMSLLEENAQLEMCEDIAKSIKMDPVFSSLTNKTQRRLYLLHTKNLPASDADIVMELLTPQMASLIEGDLNDTNKPAIQ